ncbi:hypothetical protein ACP26L_36525 (plasmid) [Paenibacillus sp. S-38]|uniref:hypothetical protein n=1 Tax=Paenibacillus sp. S-38 TaxID=3416710 RepID=UPI003CEDBAB8
MAQSAQARRQKASKSLKQDKIAQAAVGLLLQLKLRETMAVRNVLNIQSSPEKKPAEPQQPAVTASSTPEQGKAESSAEVQATAFAAPEPVKLCPIDAEMERCRKAAHFIDDGQYYVGGLVEMRVERVEARYVKTRSTDGFDTEALLYIREISDTEYIESPLDHFMFGDIFIAQILSIDNIGRLKISTKGLPIRNYRKRPTEGKIMRTVAPASNVTEIASYSEKPAHNPLKDKLIGFKAEESKPEPEPPAQPEQAKLQAAHDGREIEQVKAFVNPKLGVLSERSEAMIRELMDKHGTVAFTLAMAQVVPAFECDLGVYLAKEIDAKLSGCL